MKLLICSDQELIGDGMIKLPFIKALKTAFPDVQITWMTCKGKTVFSNILVPLVANDISTIWEETTIGTKWSDLWGNILEKNNLPITKFDGIINTSNRPFLSIITRRIPHIWHISAAANWRYSDKKPKGEYQKPNRLLDQLMDLVRIAADIPHLKPDFSVVIPPSFQEQAALLLPTTKPYFALAPGAGGKHKCWPLPYFIKIAHYLESNDITPVVILGPAELDWEEDLRAALPNACFPLQETIESSPILTIALGQRTLGAVCNDSGIGHLLAASGKPIIGLFGPTPAKKFIQNTHDIHILQAQDFGGANMLLIHPDAVIEKLKELIQNAS